MKIKRNKLYNYLFTQRITFTEFLKEMNWTKGQALKFLYRNEELDLNQSRKFINYVGAKDAYKIINWREMNVEKPKYHTIFKLSHAN